MRAGGEDIAPTNGSGSGAHIEQQLRRGDASGLQHPVRAHTQFTAACSLGLDAAHIAQKCCITDGGTDRVRIGIAVTDDVHRVWRD